MNICVDEIREIAETRLFRGGVNDDIGWPRRSRQLFNYSRGIAFRQIDRDGVSCGSAVASRETRDVMLFSEVMGQPRAQETTTTRNPDVQVNLPSGSNYIF